MADNVVLPGTGSSVAADEIGGAQYQRIKLIHGADGVNSGDVSSTNPLPVTAADGVSLLTETLTTATSSTTIDTLGYANIVTQITGVWQGLAAFESSNDSTNWNMVMYVDEDSLAMRDTITSEGIYTVRPSGRYLRLTVLNITGSLTLNTIGRSSMGLSPADSLAMAMDAQNNTPLNVTPRGAAGVAMAQDSQGFQQVASKVSTYRGTLSLGVINNAVTFPCDGHMTAMLIINVSGSAGASVDVYNGATWAGVVGTSFNNTNATIVQQGQAVSSGNIPYTIPLYGAAAIRVRCSSASAGSTCIYSVALSPFPVPAFVQAVVNQTGAGLLTTTSTINYSGTNAGAALTRKFTADATTNAANIKASAGRVVGWHLYNTTASAKYFRFFNLAAAPTMGTSSPAFVVVIPANSGASAEFTGGLSFSAGISIACTGDVADLDTTVTAANDVLGAIFYV